MGLRLAMTLVCGEHVAPLGLGADIQEVHLVHHPVILSLPAGMQYGLAI